MPTTFPVRSTVSASALRSSAQGTRVSMRRQMALLLLHSAAGTFFPREVAMSNLCAPAVAAAGRLHPARDRQGSM